MAIRIKGQYFPSKCQILISSPKFFSRKSMPSTRMISPQNNDSLLVFAMVVFLAFEIVENDLDPEGDQGQRP